MKKALMRRLRHRRSEAGFSLIELIVGMAITILVMSAVPALLQTVNTASSSAQGASIGSEQATLAIQNLDQQVTSASQVCLPTEVTTAPETVSAGFALRIEQVEPTGVQQWKQWVVNSTTGLMQEESFTAGGAGNGWVTVAKTIYNPTSNPPFQMPTAATGSPQEVLIDLEVSEQPGRLTQRLEIKSAVSAFSTPYSPSLPTECTDNTATTPSS